MTDKSENPDVLANETVLIQAKDILERLIAAVDILVDVPKSGTYNIEDALSHFDDILLQEGSSSFSDIHLIDCQCPSSEDLPGIEERMGLIEEDVEYEEPSYLGMLDVVDDSQYFQPQDRNVTFDDVLRGLLVIPPAPDAQRIINPFLEENFDDNDQLIVVDDDPLESDEAGDGDEVVDDLEEVRFLGRMMLYLGEADIFAEDENQGSGDHQLDPPIE